MAVWTTLRTFSATQAEATSVAAAATFVELGSAGGTPGNTGRKLEVRARWGSETTPVTTGATNPTGLTLAVWRSHAGKVDKIGTMFFTVTSNAIVARESAVFDFDGQAAYVTAESFVAGSTPAVTGIIEGRLLPA